MFAFPLASRNQEISQELTVFVINHDLPHLRQRCVSHYLLTFSPEAARPLRLTEFSTRSNATCLDLSCACAPATQNNSQTRALLAEHHPLVPTPLRLRLWLPSVPSHVNHSGYSGERGAGGESAIDFSSWLNLGCAPLTPSPSPRG